MTGRLTHALFLPPTCSCAEAIAHPSSEPVDNSSTQAQLWTRLRACWYPAKSGDGFWRQLRILHDQELRTPYGRVDRTPIPMKTIDTPISIRFIGQNQRISSAESLAVGILAKQMTAAIGKSSQVVCREIACNKGSDGAYQSWYTQ